MNAGVAAAAFAGCVLVLAAVSGPLVPLDLTPAHRGPTPGTGNASTSDVTLPVNVTLERARYGAGTYRLDGSRPTVDVGGVSGNPRLVFVVDFPGLGVAASRGVDLAGRANETLDLRYDTVEFSPKNVDANAYNATVSVWLYHDGGVQTELASRRVTVEVVG